MKTLLELAPRDAGSTTVEPDITFGDVDQLYAVACPHTSYCDPESWGCIGTGHFEFN
ncbi:hypothetical protein [Nocardia arthritidis]|uniref:Uncharacterized protein n=1 Tax=Nocardia arthritidis TaxID=228602 RepID=A0A6G9Y9E6_9NOCA|nr:hypothetical protein [Nocardia arthritidis]QIS09697.1 hypothetical protein F5544_08980 [Nocardia arthritidis]